MEGCCSLVGGVAVMTLKTESVTLKSETEVYV